MKILPLRYLPWLLKDMARGPLALLAALPLLVALLPRVQGAPDELVWKSFPYLLDVACFLAAVILNRSAVNRDLRSGYFRVLFSRPVQPAGYYLLRWLLGLAAVMLFAALLTGVTAWKYATPLPFLHYAPYIALQYLVLGGLILLLSVFLPEDAGPAIALCGLSAYYYHAAQPPFLFHLFGWALPPMFLCRTATGGEHGGLHWLALGYGLLVVGGAAAALQLRHFGEGGRGD